MFSCLATSLESEAVVDGAILHSIAVANAEYCWVQSHRMSGLIVDEMSPCFRHLSRGESVS